MPELDSSTIASADHDPATLELRVSFKNGSTYVYDGVPPDTAEGLFSAPSPGSYLSQFIKGSYPFRRG